MHQWIPWLVTAAVLVIAAPAIVWAARNGKKMRGAAGLPALFLGIGFVVDPPKRHMLEAAEQKKGSPENDEPLQPKD